MSKYSYQLEGTTLKNRWKHDRRHFGSFTLIGIERWYFGPGNFRWTICLFGLELNFWIKKFRK